MADNIKPYDPNKGFISFRLNPDAIKEALIEQVPYNRTMRNIYNNPEGDIRETAKVAASETPINSNPSPILNQKQIHSAIDNTNALEKLNNSANNPLIIKCI